MLDKAAIKTVIDYCREHHLDEALYLNFIAALRLPPSYLHLRLAVEALQVEYQRASRFIWFANEQYFIEEKLIISNLATALKSTKRHSNNLRGLYDTFPLAVFLLLPNHESVGFVSEIYAVLKIFALRYSLEQQRSQERAQSTLGNLGNMVTEIRRNFKNTSSKNYVIHKEVYSDLERFITLLSDKNDQIWSIPKPFIDWISTHVIAPIRTQPNKNERNLGLSNGVTGSVKTTEKHFDVEKVINIPGKSTRYLRIKPEQVVEEDESIEEILDFSVDPEHPISLETVEQSLLYGNRLRTTERLLLSLRTNVLTEHELAIFISGCVHSLQAGNEKEAICAATLLLIFITARNLDDINHFTLGHNLAPDNEGIDITHGNWRRKSIIMPNAVKPSHHHPILFEHSDYADLPLPEVLVRFLQKSVSASTEWSQLLRKVDIGEEQLLAHLKQLMASIPRRNTLAQIRLSLFQQLALKTDPGYAALVLATTEPLTPTPLYYKSVSLHQLQQSYSDCLEELGLYPVMPEHRPDAEQLYTGSYIAVDDAQLADFFRRSFEHITELFVKSSQTEQGVIAFLNALTCYTTVILLACTGHRNRTEYQFEPALFNLELDMMILSDKTQYDDAAIRFVPIADIGKAALVNYAKTCRALAAKLDDHHLKVALLKKGVWQQGDIDTPFLSMIRGSNVRAVSSEDVSLYLVSAGLNLPLNFLRHRLCSRLSDVLSADAVNWILGHVGEGEHPFSLTSTLTLTDISECRQHINDAVAPLNIQIWEAPSQRGLAALPPFKSSSGYVPEYLTIKRMSDRERIQWVKDVFRQFSQTLKPGESILEHLDEFMDVVLAKALELENHADSVACVKIINRKIERFAINNEEPQAQHWRMPLSESLVALDTRFFYEGRRVRAIRERLSERIVHPDFVIDPKEAVYEVVLSLVIQSAVHFPTTDFIRALQSERFTLNGLHFFDYRKNETLFRVYIDPITLGLIKRYPHFSEQEFSDKRFLKFARAVIQKVGLELPFEVFSSFSEFGRYIAFYDNQSTEPGLMRSFRLNKIQSNPLSHSALTRLLTPDVLPEKRQLSAPRQSANYLKRRSDKSVQLLNERKFFDGFIKTVGYKRASLDAGVTIKTVIPHIWAEFVNSSSIKISDLLAKSEHLSDAAIAVLLFMVDVGKRPGRGGRKNISFRTIKTYFSKTCVPLLDVAQEQKILEFDEDELTEFYISVLDCRELVTRPRHAEMLGDLHRCVEKHFYLPEIDWFEIEPNILKKEDKKFGNILMTSDYEQVLELLRNDPYSDERTRLSQTVIFILAYRCGMRRSEIKNRQHRDLESADGLLYVFTNKHYRLKTINANRRIPANLLLNHTEREIISQLLAFSKRLDSSPKARVFNVSDSEFALLCSRVTEAIVTVTENENARLHDCRHSFATYMCWVGIIPRKSILSLAATSWCRKPPDVFIDNWLLVTTGKSSGQGHKFLDSLAMAMGHGSPLTTLSHYVHELPLLNLEYQSFYSENNRLVTHKKLGGWLDTSEPNTRQISARSEISPHISLMQRVMKTAWQLPQTLPVKERESSGLSERNLINNQLESWLFWLAQLRDLAFIDKHSNSESSLLMSRLFDLFEERPQAAPFNLFSSGGVITASRHIHSRVKHALTGARIISVLKHLAEKSNSQSTLKNSREILLDGYAGSDGFFIADSKISELADLSGVGFSFITREKGVRKTGKLSKNGGYVEFRYKDLNITDEFYVLAIILSF